MTLTTCFSRYTFGVLLLLAPALLPGSAALGAEPRSYPMICKAGGDMLLAHDHGNQWGGHVRVRFKKARQGASVRPPRAGECAWLDRGVRANEPKRLAFFFNNKQPFNTVLLCNANGCRYRSTRSESNKMSARVSKYLLDAIQNGKTFHVHVYNCENERYCHQSIPGKYFQITRIGP